MPAPQNVSVFVKDTYNRIARAGDIVSSTFEPHITVHQGNIRNSTLYLLPNQACLDRSDIDTLRIIALILHSISNFGSRKTETVIKLVTLTVTVRIVFDSTVNHIAVSILVRHLFDTGNIESLSGSKVIINTTRIIEHNGGNTSGSLKLQMQSVDCACFEVGAGDGNTVDT